MSPQITVLVIALTIGFSVLLDLAVFLLYMYSLPAELDVHAPLVDDVDAAEEFPFPGVAAGTPHRSCDRAGHRLGRECSSG